jgi:hypothetical protein
MFSGFALFFLVSETHAYLYSGQAAESFSNPFSPVGLPLPVRSAVVRLAVQEDTIAAQPCP